MKLKWYSYLFYTMVLILVFLLIVWGIYINANITYANDHPEIMNQYGIFALLSMVMYFFYHLIFLIWSGHCHFKIKKNREVSHLPLLAITILGLIPSLIMLVYSAIIAYQEHLLVYG